MADLSEEDGRSRRKMGGAGGGCCGCLSSVSYSPTFASHMHGDRRTDGRIERRIYNDTRTDKDRKRNRRQQTGIHTNTSDVYNGIHACISPHTHMHKCTVLSLPVSLTLSVNETDSREREISRKRNQQNYEREF